MKTSIAKQLVVGVLIGLWFSVALSLFLAHFFPLGEPLNRTFFSGLSMPLFWCVVTVYLLAQHNYVAKAWLLVGLGAILLAMVAGALWL